MKKRFLAGFILLIVLAVVISAVVLIGRFSLFLAQDEYRVIKTIPKGSTFANIAANAGLATSTINAILEASKDVYNLKTIISGRKLEFVFDAETNLLKSMSYKINSDKELIVSRKWAQSEQSAQLAPLNEWIAEVKPIAYDIKIARASGVIDASLYETMIAQGADVRLVLALAETFAWQIDFAADIRKGDSFKVIYEERYLNGKYVSPGKILAAEFINDGNMFRGYYFEGEYTKAGHYDDDGNSIQKVFLKSPLQYKYISSGFSYARFNPITKKISPHRGIDYAADYNTPAVSVGDGTVVQAGWNGPYGLSVLIRHNDIYTTRYGHFSKLARGIHVGTKVKQGQIIGYVGSTGQSTGPHLHYEMHKLGKFVNPFKVKIPPGDPIDERDREAFSTVVEKYKRELASMPL